MIRLILSSMKVLIIVISTGVVALGGYRVFDHYQGQAEADYGVGESVIFTVSSKDEPEDVAKKLRKAGLIQSEQVFELTVRYVDKDLKAETYDLKKGMSVATIVDLITTEKSEAVTDVKELKITVVEGWRTEQIAEELDKLKYPPGGDAFLRAVKDYDHDNYDFLEGSKKGSLEGFLLPATYEFTNETTPDELITMMLNAFDQAVTPQMRERAESMNLSLYDVLKVAALVERETAVADERQIVADVYLDRYDQGMLLQADPTVQYVIGKPGEWWPVPTAEDLQETDSPYNLYQNEGLTPTPIANPGINSILVSAGFLIVAGIVREHGGVFISDEVQTAWGRTGGKWFGIEQWGVTPDIITSAKGLGNGVPIGLTVARPEIADSLKGATISTFGGEPDSTTAAKAVIDFIEDHKLSINAAEAGAYLRDKLEALAAKYPIIGEVRGMGLMQACRAGGRSRQQEAGRRGRRQPCMEATRENRLILVGKGGYYGNVLRISPPLNISKADVDRIRAPVGCQLAKVSPTAIRDRARVQV